MTPKANYASADFDQTHVLLINYSYTLPSLTKNSKALGYAGERLDLGRADRGPERPAL